MKKFSTLFLWMALAFPATLFPAEQTGTLSGGLAELQSSLGKWNSYKSNGKIDVAYSNEFVKLAGLPQGTTKQFRFQIESKGKNIRLVLSEMKDGSSVLNTKTHYVTEESYFRIGSDGEAMVSSDLACVDAAAGMNDFHGPLAVLSFLLQPKTVYGLRPLSAALLGDPGLWKPVLDAAASKTQAAEDGKAEVSFSQGDYRWIVALVRQGKTLVPSNVKYYATMEGVEILARDLTVDRYRENAAFVPSPEKMTLKIYMQSPPRPPIKKSELAATFSYTVENFEINPKIEDDLFSYDPAAARRIWDADRSIFITIPK